MSQFIQSLRQPFIGDNQKAELLFQIEKQLPIFPIQSAPMTGHAPSLSSRINLLKDLTKERLQSLFSKIFQKHSHFTTIHFPAQKDKLDQLKQKLLSNENNDLLIEAFRILPQEMRDWLSSAIGISDGAPDEISYGYKKIQENPRILNTTQPIIFLNGTNLVDQLIHWIDQHNHIEAQKQIVHALDKISHKLRSNVSASSIAETIETLPLELQWQMHGDIYSFSPNKIDQDEWGKHELLNNPRALLELKNPHHLQKNLLEQYLNQEHKKLENLELSKDLEEFERMTVVLQLCHPKQQKERLKWTSSRVRHWIKELELERHPASQASTNPLYSCRGAQVGVCGTHFSVFAPHAKNASVVLTAFGKEEDVIPMKKNNDGTWGIYTEKAHIGRSYRYRIENCHGHTIDRTDPVGFSTFNDSNDPKRTQSVVSAPHLFQWSDSHWMQKRKNSRAADKPLAIYEVYVESWKKKDGAPINFRELAHDLAAYAKYMKFSHVELFGVLDNQGGWGYQVHNFFSPNQRLGNSEDFQYLVNHLHENDIGVILDWVPAHYKADPWEVSMHDLDGTNHYSGGKSEWGTEFFDLSREEPRRFLKDSARYWCEHMHIDGLRVDAVSHIWKRHGKEYPSGISFLKDLNKKIHEHFPGVMMIAEDTSGCPQLTVPVEHGGIGFDLEWGIYEGMKLRWFLQTPPAERSKHHREKFMDQLYAIKNGEKKLITHSHDEVANRHWWEGFPEYHDKTLYKISALGAIQDKFADIRNFHSWQILSPSHGYLMHMGEEIAQKRSWDTGISSWDGSLEWYLLHPHCNHNSYLHSGMQKWISDLNSIYCEKGSSWKKGGSGFSILCDHPANNVIAYERCDDEGRGLIIVHNFSHGDWKNYNIPLGEIKALERLQDLKVIAHSEDCKYGGKGKYVETYPFIHRDHEGKPTHCTIGLPMFSTIVLEKKI